MMLDAFARLRHDFFVYARPDAAAIFAIFAAPPATIFFIMPCRRYAAIAAIHADIFANTILRCCRLMPPIFRGRPAPGAAAAEMFRRLMGAFRHYIITYARAAARTARYIDIINTRSRRAAAARRCCVARMMLRAGD